MQERTNTAKFYLRLQNGRPLTWSSDSLKQRLSISKQKLITIILIVATVLYVYVNVLIVESHTKWRLNEAIKRLSAIQTNEICRRSREKKSKCILPLHVNPFDEFVLPYIEADKLDCKKKAPLTFVDYENGLLLYTEDGHRSGFTCYYLWLYRFLDLYSNYSNVHLLPKSGVRFSNKNYVAKVLCFHSGKVNEKSLVYTNVHLWIPDYQKTNATGPSIFILVIESLSRFSFDRFMSKTNTAMKQLNYFTTLEGFVKVGVNSFPNAMALLTGKAFTNASYKKGYWDNKLNYIWKPFKRKGYVTAFVEDFVVIGLFNYLKMGFKHPPTDFYPRPYWLQTFTKSTESYDELMANKSHFCYDNHGSKAELFMQQLLQFSKKMSANDQPYFMYSFMSQLTHNNINDFNFIDEHVADFIYKMANYLSNTVFIIMGDHGTRYGPFTDTPMGSLETRLPFLSIRIPDKLNEKYPHLRKVIEINKQSLLSAFDVHQLLLDISRDVYELDTRKVFKPLNPLRFVVPPERTCKDALIKKPFCVCNGKFEVHKFDVRYRVDLAILDFANILKKWISYYSIFLPMCVQFEDLTKTMDAEIILPDCNETFSSVERLNVIIKLMERKEVISAVIKRVMNASSRKWSEWAVDHKYVNITQLKQKVKDIFCG